jgi:heat shock protein HslJ
MNVMPSSNRRHAARLLEVRKRSLAAIALAGALAVAGCQAGDSLAGPTWQWTAPHVTNPAGQSVVPDPESYTIEFLTDGTVNVKADCNTLTGSYTVGVPLDLTIDLATPTRDACGDLSLDSVYLEYLSQISSYSTDGGELRLFFADDVGAMQFRVQGS